MRKKASFWDQLGIEGLGDSVFRASPFSNGAQEAVSLEQEAGGSWGIGTRCGLAHGRFNSHPTFRGHSNEMTGRAVQDRPMVCKHNFCCIRTHPWPCNRWPRPTFPKPPQQHFLREIQQPSARRNPGLPWSSFFWKLAVEGPRCMTAA